jgi:type II secretory ATPase GspE/PulE/Tfp pilus assembly ATPase PilB-like protein
MLEEPRKKLPLNKIRRQEEERRAQERAQKQGLKYVDLTATPIDREAVTMLSEKEAKKAHLAIVQKIGKKLEIVIQDHEIPATQDMLKQLKDRGHNIDIFLVSETSLKRAWQIYETYTKPKESLKGTFQLDGKLVKELKHGLSDVKALKEKILELPTSKALSVAIAGAYFARASDIHFEPGSEKVKLRYRIDGVLNDVVELAMQEYNHLLNRVKILSGLKINIHNINQDGRFSFNLPLDNDEAIKIDVRVSILPEAYGETIVMRLLGIGAVDLSIDKLGIRQETFSVVKDALAKPHGLILTTGPTGSGKTTTLYSFLKHVNHPEIKIITAEDPIEYQIKGVTQSQINSDKGYTFAQALRAIVRQDPDVILVGEIRDRETADTALQASLTGHLVFSTVHTNDAAGAIPRLRDLGAEEKSVTTALNLVIAQRLVRVLCPKCKEAYDPSEEERNKIEMALKGLKNRDKYPPLKKLYRPKGCDECLGLGYKGRVGIFEVFAINPELEKLILSRATHTEILELLQQQGFITMKQDGYLKVLEGTTSLEEVDRVT